MLPEDSANGPESPENGGEGEPTDGAPAQDAGEKLAAALQPPPLDEASEAYLRRAQLAEDRLGEVLGAYRQLKVENEGFRERLTRNLERRFEQRHERLLLKFIEILDNLDRALEAAETTYTGDPMIQGLILVRTQLLQTLQEEGLERIPVLGLPYDPHTSEAVATQPVEEREHHHLVVKDVLRGYRLNGRLVRAARVVVGEFGGAPGGQTDDEALQQAPTAEVVLPPEPAAPASEAERIRRTPTVAMHLPPGFPTPPPSSEERREPAAGEEGPAEPPTETARIIVPADETEAGGTVATDEPTTDERGPAEDEPLPPIPPDLEGDPELDAIIARAEGREPEESRDDDEVSSEPGPRRRG